MERVAAATALVAIRRRVALHVDRLAELKPLATHAAKVADQAAALKPPVADRAVALKPLHAVADQAVEPNWLLAILAVAMVVHQAAALKPLVLLRVAAKLRRSAARSPSWVF